MTILAQLGSQSFNPQDRDIPFTVAVGATRVQITFTHGDWPEGPVLQFVPVWGGVAAGATQIGGGPLRDKAGNPIGGTRETAINVAKPPGRTSGTVQVRVLQTFTSAIRVESF